MSDLRSQAALGCHCTFAGGCGGAFREALLLFERMTYAAVSAAG
ncbi:hypothetical protein WG908_12125 [Sphingobium sp. AN641]